MADAERRIKVALSYLDGVKAEHEAAQRGDGYVFDWMASHWIGGDLSLAPILFT